MQDVGKASSAARADSSRCVASGRTLSDRLTALGNAAEGISSAVNDMAQEASGALEAVDAMDKSAGRNEKSIDDMLDDVRKFRV